MSAPESIEIVPVDRPLQGTACPPGSKSLTNRALICAALATDRSTLTNALESEDTQVMVSALQTLGIDVEVDQQRHTVSVAGCGGSIPASAADLYIANSGTSVRFLAAMLTLGQGRYRLDGTPRMRERPIGDLMAALNGLGASLHSEWGTDCPPIVVQAAGLPGGRAAVRGDVSSQFLSGLLMVAPYARQGVELVVDGELVSKPYVRMTLAVMQSFGVQVAYDDLSRFAIPSSRYRGITYAVEPDASAASYFFAAAAITGGTVTVAGLSRDSLQGDVAFVEVLAQMGCAVSYGQNRITVAGGPLRGIDVNMNAISDTVQTLAAVALFAAGPTTVRNVGHVRHKETDRIRALATELRKLGAAVNEHADGLTIRPGALRGAKLTTYDDHRMAMSLALIGLRVPGVTILDPGCTAKTYPGYFVDLAKLCQS